MKILILGVSGLIGSTIYRYFDSATQYNVVGTVRTDKPKFSHNSNNIRCGIDALNFDSVKKLIDEIRPDQIINCIGITKHVPAQSDAFKLIQLNSAFPHFLANLSTEVDSRLIHISTDCVFAGDIGGYTEMSRTDANDMYGKTKAIGEIHDKKHVTIRTSTIGHEIDTKHGLLEWFLSQNKSCFGYRNAIFSGIPTIRLAKILASNVVPEWGLTGLFNLSADPINKFDLLNKIKQRYRKDIEIVASDDFIIDRSLNGELFKSRTGVVLPDWDELIFEMYQTRN